MGLIRGERPQACGGRRAAALLVVVAALAAGCSGTDDDERAGADATTEPSSVEQVGAAGDDAAILGYVGVATSLADELRAEMVLTAQVAGGVTGAAERLAEQREATDEALATYQRSTDGLEVESPEWDEQLQQTALRLEGIETMRLSVDNAQTDPPEMVKQYDSTLRDLAGTVGAAQWDATTAEGVRTPLLLGNALQFYDGTATQLALLTLVVANGGPVSWTTPTTTVPCDPPPSPCVVRERLEEAETSIASWAAATEELAGPAQKQMMRDVWAGPFSETSGALTEAMAEGRPVAEVVSLEAWVGQVDLALTDFEAATQATLRSLGM